MLNPWRLRLLSRLDTLGTIRAVAQDANLSASSVSLQLAVLETETRTRLLERTGRRVRLTPAGQMLARRARAILDHMDTVEAELRGLREEPAGLVRLCRESGFEPRVACRFSNYLMTLQHVAAGLSIALLPELAVDPRYQVVTRELATPVSRTITAVVRRGSPRRAAVNLVLNALREQPIVHP